MNKLNNRGFAVSTILYGILTLVIIILMLVFGIMKASKDMNKDLVSSIEESVNKCALIEIDLENHMFSNRVVDINEYYSCIGKEAVTYLYGDANENGEVTEDDYFLILKHINFPKSNPLTLRGKVNSDVNLDGVINLDDAYCILRFVEGIGGCVALPLE